MRGRSGWRRSGGGNGGGGVGGPMFQTGPPGPYGAPVPPHPGPVYACWPAPFDLTLCEATFPRAKEVEDSDLAQAINKRHQEIMPTSAEQSAVVSLVNKVKGALQKIASNPDQSASMVLEEFREVGSFRKETMLAGHNVADIVVVFRSLPTFEAVSALGQKIVEDLKAGDKEGSIVADITFAPPPSRVYSCLSRDFGCEISGPKAQIHILVTTLPSNAKHLDPDLHLKETIMMAHMAALRHARWFEENAATPTIRTLVRIMKDIRNRFEQLQPLSVWIIERLSHYAVLNTPSQKPLTVSQAFCRFFQLLSAGFLLPSSIAVGDPCERNRRIHQSLTYEEMDQLCSAAQTLLRIICHGGYKHVLGLETSKSGNNCDGLVTDVTFWGDVIVTPLQAAYSDKVFEPMYEEDGKEKSVAATTEKSEAMDTQS